MYGRLQGSNPVPSGLKNTLGMYACMPQNPKTGETEEGLWWRDHTSWELLSPSPSLSLSLESTGILWQFLKNGIFTQKTFYFIICLFSMKSPSK